MGVGATNNLSHYKDSRCGADPASAIFCRVGASGEAGPPPASPPARRSPWPSGAALRPRVGPGPHTHWSGSPGAREGRGIPLNSQSLFLATRDPVSPHFLPCDPWLPGPSRRPPAPRHPKAFATQLSLTRGPARLWNITLTRLQSLYAFFSR